MTNFNTTLPVLAKMMEDDLSLSQELPYPLKKIKEKKNNECASLPKAGIIYNVYYFIATLSEEPNSLPCTTSSKSEEVNHVSQRDTVSQPFHFLSKKR